MTICLLEYGGRFFWLIKYQTKGIYQLDIQNYEELVISLEKNITDFIVPVINAGISQFFILFPQYSCLASYNLKKYLGIE